MPQHPFPQLIFPRILNLLERFKSKIWKNIPCDDIRISGTGSCRQHMPFTKAVEQTFTPIDTFPHFWGTKYQQTWFKVELPKTADERERFFFWEDGGEATVYVDGIPYAGIDIPHPYCKLPPNVSTVYVESICLQTGIWAPNPHNNFSSEKGSRLSGARLAFRNEDYWHAFIDLKVLIDLLKAEHKAVSGSGDAFGARPFGYREGLDKASPLLRRVLRKLDAATNVYEREGVTAFRELSKTIFRELEEENPGLKAIHTGHAHIDLVWLWPEQCGVFKATHTFATALRLMEQFPEYRFGYSQPASYEAVGKHSPKLLDQVQSRMKSGEWELTGASYVENDTQLPCGEAFLRGILLGQDITRDLRGAEATTYWLPDVFGYSGCTPQILCAAGVACFYTTKLTWSALHRHPYNSFNWIGHDGSQVLAHISYAHGYNETVSLDTLKNAELTYRQADVHDETLVPTGYGDGGGGTTEEMCERVRRLNKVKGVPACTWDRIETFFERLKAVQNQLPDYEGELYLEYHRGVQTTHGSLKASFRNLERALQTLEAVNAATGSGAIDLHYWKRLVFAQFHDYIPGSSIHEVYNEGIPELDTLAERAIAEATRNLMDKTGTNGNDALFNPTSYPKTIWIKSNSGTSKAELPALCGRSLTSLEAQPIGVPVEAEIDRLANERLQARFNAQGEICSLVIDGVTIPQTASLGQLEIFPDHPHHFEAWELDRPTLDNGAICDAPAEVETGQSEPQTGFLRVKKQLSANSSAIITYSLSAGSPVLEVTAEIDWQDEASLLRMNFSTDFHGRNARYGAPFGSTLRGQRKGPTHEEAQWEVPGSRWACVADENENEGLFLATEAKYGFACRRGLLTVSLVKSAKVTHSENEPIRELQIDSAYSDLGMHRIKLVIGRFHNRAPRNEQPMAYADGYFTPALPYKGSSIEGVIEGLCGGDSLHIHWAIPQADGSVLLRLHETLGYRGTCRIQTDRTVSLCDARGRDASNPLENGEIRFKPYELITVRLAPKK